MTKFKIGDEKSGREIVQMISETGNVQWFKVRCTKCQVRSTMSSTSFMKVQKRECIYCYRKRFNKAGYDLIKANNKLQSDRRV